MTKTNIAIALLVCIGLGYGIGRYVQPAKVEVKETTKEVIKRDVVTVVKEITRPDGTKETETRTEDRSTETSDTAKNSKVTAQRPAWKVNGMIGYVSDKSKTEYGVMVQKDYIGPVSLGAYATTEKTVGLTVGFSF